MTRGGLVVVGRTSLSSAVWGCERSGGVHSDGQWPTRLHFTIDKGVGGLFSSPVCTSRLGATTSHLHLALEGVPVPPAPHLLLAFTDRCQLGQEVVHLKNDDTERRCHHHLYPSSRRSRYRHPNLGPCVQL